MPLINIPILVGTKTKYHWNNKKFNVSNEMSESSIFQTVNYILYLATLDILYEMSESSIFQIVCLINN